ncbi:MAG: tyrosine-protein phosphatase [Burkholderiales bacterium]|nr:tyrosine-protein phosphatase [Burkholderiales bacterium]MDE2398907.1 tyrosine-protein phosphatase [Burkholderiales bacterium]MDE2456733.1 tyrosine-protein phosphatase [Burkholderiales bacterium]
MQHEPSRILPLEGASNFRDLGGYAMQDGRRVRWRRLFRSDHLAGLTGADHQRLAGIGLAQVFDFRGVDESAAAPNQLPGVAQYSLAIEPTVVQRMRDLAAAGRRLTAPMVVELMKDLYRGLVDEHAPLYARLFEALLTADAPLVFHCTAGKDRTGVAAALILLALGASRETVFQDFLLTNECYRRPQMPPTETPAEALAVLWQVQPVFLETALDSIEAEQGGIEAYFERRLGLGRAARQALAERYLES